MATQNKKTRDSLPVGAGWRYRCLTCNFEVGIDKAFPETCPGCHAPGWWGHLVTTSVLEKLNQKTEDGFSIKNSEATMPGGIKTRIGILSQENNAVDGYEPENNGIFETSPARKRGRPHHDVPESLILELSNRGFSSRAMVGELNKRGYKTGYKTVQRRLQASLL